jgi:hypothetical protein
VYFLNIPLCILEDGKGGCLKRHSASAVGKGGWMSVVLLDF